jgi:REP element-mobilizing transposase RayT
MTRGNRKGRIFEDDRDRVNFLRIVGDAVGDHAVECLAYCLMGNHYHLLVHTPRANISAFMKAVNGRFTQYSNRRHKWTGHVFEGRFKSPIIDDDVYLRTAFAYVARNPVDAGFVGKAELWRWSSYAAALGLRQPEPFVSTKWLRRAFPSASLRESRALYAAAVCNFADDFGLDPTTIVAGSWSLKAKVRELIGRTMYMGEVPRSYRAMARPELKDILSVATRSQRLAAVRRAHTVYGYKLSEIAASLSMHPTTVSRLLAMSRRRTEH